MAGERQKLFSVMEHEPRYHTYTVRHADMKSSLGDHESLKRKYSLGVAEDLRVYNWMHWEELACIVMCLICLTCFGYANTILDIQQELRPQTKRPQCQHRPHVLLGSPGQQVEGSLL